MKKIPLNLILPLILSCLIIAPATAHAEVTVTDGLGRTVEVQERPQRIVTTIASTTEIALDLGLEEKVVGVPASIQFLTYVPKLQSIAEEKEKVGGYDLSLEKIAALEPDLVLVDSGTQADVVEDIQELGTVVYAAGGKDLGEVQESILDIGVLTGTLRRAREIVGEMVHKQIRLESAVQDLDRKKKTFYVLSPEMYTAGKNTLVGQILQMAGLENVFADISGFRPVNTEEVIDRDPELIIGNEDMGLSVEDLETQLGLDGVRAVEEEQVIFLSSAENSMIDQPGTKIVDGAIKLFERVYETKVNIPE
ncbi:MAG: ABC transporter substrate-binding protein [Candidatus Acetothermia bacterium]